MALHDLWESGKSRCMTVLFFRVDSSHPEAGSLNTACLTVAPICLNTKTAKKKKKKKEPCCPCFASSSSIISIVGGVPGLRGPAWLAELQRVHGAGQSHLQAHSGRLPPPGLRWQHPPCLWGRPLCSRCRCLSRRCLHRLQQQNKTQARLSTAQKMKHYSTIKPNCATLNCCLQGSLYNFTLLKVQLLLLYINNATNHHVYCL